MTKYKLLYFNAQGNGEAIRYIFAVADQEYVDERLEWGSEEWTKLKPLTRWGMLPQLTIDDDQPICQTQTICRVLGSQFGLMGTTKKDEIYIDMLMGCVDDAIMPLLPIYLEKDEARKTELKKEYEKKYPDMLRRLEGFLCENNGGDGWFVGASVTVADCYLYHRLSWLPEDGYTNCFDNCPKLAAFMERFKNLDKISAWIAKRPKTKW